MNQLSIKILLFALNILTCSQKFIPCEHKIQKYYLPVGYFRGSVPHIYTVLEGSSNVLFTIYLKVNLFNVSRFTNALLFHFQMI